jgi:hypothetical protein
LTFQYGLSSVPFWIVIAVTAAYILIDLLLRIAWSLPRSGLWQRFREGSVQGEHADPFSDPLNRFFFVVICVGVSFLIAWSTGYSTARDQRRFLVTRSPKERIVLRRYGDMFVIADLDRSKRTVNQNFTFQAMTGSLTMSPAKTCRSIGTVLHIVADARHFDHSAFSERGAELRRFAAKNFQTVESDRELCAFDTANLFF